MTLADRLSFTHPGRSQNLKSSFRTSPSDQPSARSSIACSMKSSKKHRGDRPCLQIYRPHKKGPTPKGWARLYGRPNLKNPELYADQLVLSAQGHRHKVARFFPGVDLARTGNLLVRVLHHFIPLGQPAHRPRDAEQ